MVFLEFEKPLESLHVQLEKFQQIDAEGDIDVKDKIVELEKKIANKQREIFSNLNRWQKVQLSRHPERPYTLYYINEMCKNFVELHGDRNFKDDKAICITISKGSGPLMYKEMNLHIFKNRQQVLETLAKDEDVYYYDEVGYFFPKSGLTVPIPKHMRDLFFIQLFLTSYQRSRLEYDMYEPSTALS